MTEIREALGPVMHWYQSDEDGPRPTINIVMDLVSDHQRERSAMIKVQSLVLRTRRECEEGHPISAFNLANDIIAILGLPAPEKEEGREDG